MRFIDKKNGHKIQGLILNSRGNFLGPWKIKYSNQNLKNNSDSPI